MERFKKNDIETNADKEKLMRLKYKDLVEMYYFEALRHKRPIVERALEKSLMKFAMK